MVSKSILFALAIIALTSSAWASTQDDNDSNLPLEENLSYLAPMEGVEFSNAISPETKAKHFLDDPDEVEVEEDRRSVFSRRRRRPTKSCDARCFKFFGVASGDATDSKVIIWTRLTPKYQQCMRCKPKLVLSVYEAEDDDDDLKFDPSKKFDVQADSGRRPRGKLLYRRQTRTSSLVDFTVKLDVGRLPSNGKFKYVFKIVRRKKGRGRGRTKKIFGFTKTFPSPNTPARELSVRFAQLSCQFIEAGYYLAYRDIAQDPDIDFVLHVGDSIYEYAQRGAFIYSWPNGMPPDRIAQPDHVTYTLEDYRLRHASYKGDEFSKAAFQRKPFYMIWDDHEVVNGGYSNGADEGNYTIVSFTERKQNALRAFYEWSPIRRMNRDLSQAYRAFRYGKLMDLTIVEERYFAKTKPKPDFVSAVTASFQTHQFFGPQQRNWLFGELMTNQAAWQGIGSSLSFSTPHPLGLSPRFWFAEAENLIGYYQERHIVMQGLKKTRKKNIVILMGDKHHFALRRVTDTMNYTGYTGFPFPNAGEALAGEVVAMEVQTTSVSSPGPETFVTPEEFAQLSALLQLEWSYIEPQSRYGVRGYLVNHVQKDKWTVSQYGYKTNQDLKEKPFIVYIGCFKQGYIMLNQCDCEP